MSGRSRSRWRLIERERPPLGAEPKIAPKRRKARAPIVSSLSFFGLAFYILVMTGAFAVRSAAGFGAVLIAMPMLAFVLPVSTAVSVTTALTTITSVHHVSRDWRRVAWRQFATMAFYSAIGIGVGFYFIHLLDEDALRRGLGVFLIVYSLYAMATAKASPVLPVRWCRALAAGTGVA